MPIRRSPRERSFTGDTRLTLLLILAILSPLLLIAAAPDWWNARSVLQAGAAADDYAVLNQGQLKHLAAAAVAELNDKLVGGAGAVLTQMVTSWQDGSVPRDDYAAVNVGQLKALAALFHARLGQPYPWAGSTQPADDYALANIGQAKALFSFAPQVLPASWLAQYGLPANTDPNAVIPGSATSANPAGVTYWAALVAGIDPNSVADSDGDGVRDIEDAVPYDEDLNFTRIPEPHYAVIDVGEGSSYGLRLGDGGRVAWSSGGGGAYTAYSYWPDANGNTATVSGWFPDILFDGAAFYYPYGIDASGSLVGEMWDWSLFSIRPVSWDPASTGGAVFLPLPATWTTDTSLWGWSIGFKGWRSGPSDNGENYTTLSMRVRTATNTAAWRQETSIIKYSAYGVTQETVDHVIHEDYPLYTRPASHPAFGVQFEITGPAAEHDLYWQAIGGGSAISVKYTRPGKYFGVCYPTGPEVEDFDYSFNFVPGPAQAEWVMRLHRPGEAPRELERTAQLRHDPRNISSPDGRWIAGCDAQSGYQVEVLLPGDGTWNWHPLYAGKAKEPVFGSWSHGLGRAFGQLLVRQNGETRLWINGRTRSFQELMPAAIWARYTNRSFVDMNGTGTVVVTAKKVKNDDDTAIPASDQKSHVLVLTPVDITVRKKSEADAPPTGLLVKKGTQITFDINGTAPASAFPVPANAVKWKTRQLKHDGTLTDWADVPGEGPELDFTANTSGVFQAKAVLTVAGGQPQDLPLVREMDAPHADDSEGTVEGFHKKGAEDYFGVADTDWQIAVRDAALSNLGSTYYKNQGTCVVQGSTVAPNPSNKCNIFIYHKCGDGGAPVPLTRGGLPGLRTGPPLAIDFWNDNTGRKDNANRTIESWEIPNWIRLPDATMPQPGWVPARPNLNGEPDLYGTHVGIFDYDGSWISAGFSKVNKHYHPKSPGYQPQGYRRYSGGN